MYLTTNTLRIGVLTSGGDAPGMNAIIAGACDRAEHLGGHAHGIHGGFAGLAELRSEPIGAVEARAHLHESGTWLGTSRWPSLRSPEGRRVCADALEALALDGLVVIGGNGSAMGAAALADRIPVSFVPATIDRDISGTDVTVGMDSAVGYAVDTIDRLRVTGRSLRGRAFLVQTLGAPNGFLADAVASAAGIDHVLVPEREHDLDEIAVALRELALEGSAIAVMSEAIGDAVRVSEELAQRAGIRVHPTILGHAQRAATPSAQDRTLGQAAGRAAVDALAQGSSSFIALSAAGAVKSADLVAGIGPATPSITPETKERSHEPRL
jgi:6-phosphofructokinase 1